LGIIHCNIVSVLQTMGPKPYISSSYGNCG